MIRATTPTHKFTLPFESALVDKFLLTYKQGDKVVLTKTKEHMVVDGNTWSVKLTQEETNLFEACCMARAQVRVLTTGGDSLVSNEVMMSVLPVHNDEVL